MDGAAALGLSGRARAFIHELLLELARVLDVASIMPRGSVRTLLRAWLALTVAQRLGRESGRGFELNWIGPHGVIHGAVHDPSEIRVIREVFVNEQYALPDDVTPSTILDLGSNVGMSILYFRDRYPDARIIGVEPAPAAFARLQRNTFDLPLVSLVRAAAVGASRTVELVVGRESWVSSIHGGGRDGQLVERVTGLTIEQILHDAGLERAELIKMDVEGAEVEIIEQSAALRTADWLIFEFHREHTTSSVWQLIDRLPQFELARIAGDTSEHPLVTLRRHAGGESTRRPRGS